MHRVVECVAWPEPGRAGLVGAAGVQAPRAWTMLTMAVICGALFTA